MKRISILLATFIFGITGCNNSPDPASEKTVTRNIKGSEIEITAPDEFVPICEISNPLWTSVNSDMPDSVHLLTCFIRQGEWQSMSDISVDDLHPLLRAAIHKNMISETMTKEEFSGMLKVIARPADESSIVLREDTAYCYRGFSRKNIKAQDKEKEFNAISINCLTLVRDKYLLLILEDEYNEEKDVSAAQQSAIAWLRLVQKAN
jgi:hypothetical protein